MANWNNLPSRRNDRSPGNRHFFSDFFDLYARDFFSPMLNEEDALDNFSPRVEVHENEKGYEVRAELPGMKEEDINLTLQDNSLILEGERRKERTEDRKKNFRSEFSYGSFYRTIPFRCDVDNNNIEANYRDGILSVSLLKKADGTEKSRKIQINKSSGSGSH